MEPKFAAPQRGLDAEGIIDDLRGRIKRGELKVGEKLPTTRELCRLYDVSPNTLSRCIRRLKDLGYLISRVGAGIYVSDPGGKQRHQEQDDRLQTTAFVFRIAPTGDQAADNYLSQLYDNAILGIQDESLDLGIANGAVICPDSVVGDKRALATFIDQHSAVADGIYLVGVVPDTFADHLAETAGKPTVFVVTGDFGKGGRHNIFCVDLYRSAYSVLQHLLDRGYQRIACLGGMHIGTGMFDQAYHHREKAWFDIMNAHDRPIDASLLFASGESAEQIQEAAHGIVTLPANDRPDAVFCFNDMRAMVLLQAARNAGLRVPGDLAIAGFDGSPKAIREGISTMELPFYPLGRNAVTSMRLLIKKQVDPPVFSSYAGGVRAGKTT